MAADLDGNIMLDYEESVQYLLSRNRTSLDNIHQEWFSSVDTDEDGFLTFDEIDSVEITL